jgi:hypothetical protein
MKKILFLICTLSSILSFAGDFDFGPKTPKPAILKTVEAAQEQYKYPWQGQHPRGIRTGPPVWQMQETESLPLHFSRPS